MKELFPPNLWTRSPETLKLDHNEVHIWGVKINQTQAQVDSLYKILSTQEQARADRFHFERDMRNSVVSRGVLRILLSRYSTQKETELAIHYTDSGKPYLVQNGDSPPVRFSKSQSREVALYAFSLNRELGIDVEFIRPDLATMELAERFFSADEVASLRELPPAVMNEVFFNCWTRKEAFIKGNGEGLSTPLDSFSVSLALKPRGSGEESPAPFELVKLSAKDSSSVVREWALRNIEVGGGYVAALAVRGNNGVKINCYVYE